MILNEKLLEETGCRRVAWMLNVRSISLTLGMGEYTQRIVLASFLNVVATIVVIFGTKQWRWDCSTCFFVICFDSILFLSWSHWLFYIYIIYYMAVLIVVNCCYFRHKMERIVLAANYINETFRMVTYIAMMKLYKGLYGGAFS